MKQFEFLERVKGPKDLIYIYLGICPNPKLKNYPHVVIDSRKGRQRTEVGYLRDKDLEKLEE